MSNSLLYRGYCPETKSWVKGYLLKVGKVTSKTMIIENASVDFNNHAWIHKAHTVVPESVGQDTGMSGVFSKPVFAGDIIKIRHTIPYYDLDSKLNKVPRRAYNIGEDITEIGTVFVYYYRNYVVEFSQKKGRYILRNGSDQHDMTWNYLYNHNAEIIGTFYENPELLIPGDTDNGICKIS